MARVSPSPHLVMRPFRSTWPDWCFLGTKPKCAPTDRNLANRLGTSTALLKANAVPGLPPGAHPAPASQVRTGLGQDQPVQRVDLHHDGLTQPEQWFHDGAERWTVLDERAYPRGKLPGAYLSNLEPECLE